MPMRIVPLKMRIPNLDVLILIDDAAAPFGKAFSDSEDSDEDGEPRKMLPVKRVRGRRACLGTHEEGEAIPDIHADDAKHPAQVFGEDSHTHSHRQIT